MGGGAHHPTAVVRMAPNCHKLQPAGETLQNISRKNTSSEVLGDNLRKIHNVHCSCGGTHTSLWTIGQFSLPVKFLRVVDNTIYVMLIGQELVIYLIALSIGLSVGQKSRKHIWFAKSRVNNKRELLGRN